MTIDKMISELSKPSIEFEDGPVLSAACKNEVANAIKVLLNAVGEDPERKGLIGTPSRVARMYDELLVGYKIDPDKLLNNALFDVEYDEMVVVKDIEFYSLCEHHLLPILGRCHIGYLPDTQVIGLSKIPRLVDMFARRLQVQERMTKQIAIFLSDLVKPRGVGVILEADHLCTGMRGVQKRHAKMVTSSMLGGFRDNAATREEFLAHVRANSQPMQ